jgi:hypothetical protein
MSFAIFKGEKSIKDLVGRLFHLPEKGAKSATDQAAAALLKANPQLKDISKVPVGSVITIPPTAPPLKTAEQVPTGDSAALALIAQQAQQALDGLGQQLAKIDSRAANGANAFLALAQSPQMKTFAEKSADLKTELPGLLESVQATVQTTKANQDAHQKVMAGLRTSLQSLVKSKA